jgi:hypothetical protein
MSQVSTWNILPPSLSLLATAVRQESEDRIQVLTTLEQTFMAKLSTGVIGDNGVDILELDKDNTSRSIIKGLDNQARKRKSLIIRSGDNQAFNQVSPNFSNSADD